MRSLFYITKTKSKTNIMTNIVVWIKNPFRRMSEHNMRKMLRKLSCCEIIIYNSIVSAIFQFNWWQWIINIFLYIWYYSYQNHSSYQIVTKRKNEILLLGNHKLLCDCIWNCRLFGNSTKLRLMYLNEKMLAESLASKSNSIFHILFAILVNKLHCTYPGCSHELYKGIINT